MGSDLGPVGELVARLFELVETDYEGKAMEVRAALVVVDLGVTDADGAPWTHVRFLFGQAPDFDPASSSSSYMAGVAAEVLEAAITGDRETPDD